MKTKKQKQTSFRKCIQASEIIECIENLEKQLMDYRQSTIVHKNAYVVSLEIECLFRTFTLLTNQLDDLDELANQWEAPQ